MKKEETLFTLSSTFDSKHINNLSSREVPVEILNELEKGCPVEVLEDILCKGFPICQYRTQITIHGQFPELSTNRIGRYVNIVRNKNNSVGVRWTAIDYKKKSRLFGCLSFADGDWCICEDSQKFCLRRFKRIDKESYDASLAEFKRLADSIDRSLFKGTVECYIARTLWASYLVLDVNINTFYEKDTDRLFENLSGGKSLAKVMDEEHEHRLAKIEKERVEAEARDKKLAELKAQMEKARAEFLKNEALPGFAEKTKIVEAGDMIAVPKWAAGKWVWKYYIAYKSFGKVITCHCDADGKKLGKGSQAPTKPVTAFYRVK